jgi:CO/xanthine dehydrogenase FAD-binding subunit
MPMLNVRKNFAYFLEGDDAAAIASTQMITKVRPQRRRMQKGESYLRFVLRAAFGFAAAFVIFFAVFFLAAIGLNS